jgi:DNA-directed RNA polymerase subunit F
MFSKNELLDAIDDLEMAPATYQNAEKLATFYTLYDHLYVREVPKNLVEMTREVTIDRYGDTEFLKAIDGIDAEKAWKIMDELMSTLMALQRKLYDATIDRIKQD